MVDKQQDVLIVGGGVIGICIAYYLVEQGHSVTLVEKDDIAAGSSYGNAGLIVPSHVIPLAAPGVPRQGLKWMFDAESPLYIKPRPNLALMRWMWHFLVACRKAPMQHTISVLSELNRFGLGLHQELANIDGLDFGYEQKGGLYLYNTDNGFKKGVKGAHLLKEVGVQTQVLSDLDAVRSIEPQVSESIIGGVYYPDDTHLIPDRFVHQMAQLVESRGVCIKTNTEVLHMETSGNRLSTVITTKGDFKSDWVVLAAGAWSPIISRTLGFELPVQPAKGYSITVKRPTTSPSLPIYFGEQKVVATPMDDMLRFAGTLELAGHDLSINQRRVAAIRRASQEYLLGMNDLELIETWRGLRPLTPDTLPIIGATQRYPNLILATGHGMLGMSLAPVTGKLVAQIVVGEKSDKFVESFRMERF